MEEKGETGWQRYFIVVVVSLEPDSLWINKCAGEIDSLIMYERLHI